ncbi:hypothetical protein [Providencia stuartii]|uniref:hypothetical protein n=1 Tax=Providencia stuartii TaxID=588 RepID=UPI0018C67725|nr:hypothetical protein [Providencia stuartii]MBG5920635.1 hypothetical protein [Providencia stuartii]
MAKRTKINHLICLVTLAIGLIIGGSVSASVSEVNTRTAPVIGHAPVVSDVTFDKMTPAVHDTVTATPTITDEDHDTPVTSLYQWQLDGKDIPKATENSYRLVPGDGNGKKLTIMVTPQTDPAITEPATGIAFTSSPIITQGLAPEAVAVKIYGKPEVGQLLTGSYLYHDSDTPKDLEDTSSSGTQFEWICSRSSSKKTLATAKTYTLQDADVGCEISFNVTPRSISGIPNTGAQAQSKALNVIKAVPPPEIRLFNGNQIGDRSGPGYNIEINYVNPGYGALKAIVFQEHKGGSEKNYPLDEVKVGELTNSHSLVTDSGSAIKFGKNARSNTGATISVYATLHFQNGKRLQGSSGYITLE